MLDVKIYGDPILREKAVPVGEVNGEIRSLADKMIETMHADNGIGLAAEQVGRTESICVVDVPIEMDFDQNSERLNPGVDMPLVLIDPEITRGSEETDVAEEGCLSLPGISLPVSRSKTIDVRYTDLGGSKNEVTVCGLVARCIQHETDHLDGVLIIDRVPRIKRISVSGRLKRMKKETQSRLANAR